MWNCIDCRWMIKSCKWITYSGKITLNKQDKYNWFQEWMNYTHIQPNIRLVNPISKRFTNYWRFTSDKLSRCVEQRQDLMQRSTISFLIVEDSGPFLSFNHFQVAFFTAHFYSTLCTLMCACWVSVTNSLPTPTITKPPSVECQDFINSDQIDACVAIIYLILKSHPNDWQN